MQIRLLSGICRGAAFIVDQSSKTKTVEKFGKDSPTVFIYRFSGIPASSYPRCSIRRSSENVSKSIECSNARSMDTRQSLKAFYASIQYGVPVVHSSLLHCKLMFLYSMTLQNYGFSWGPANFFRENRYKAKCVIHSASANVYFVFVTLLLGKFKVLPLSANFDDGLELYIFFKWIIPVISHFFQRIRLPLYTFPSILELEIYTFS